VIATSAFVDALSLQAGLGNPALRAYCLSPRSGRQHKAFYEAGSCQEMSSGWLVHPSIRVSTRWAIRSRWRGLI